MDRPTVPARWQRVFGTAWDLTTIKTGGYVSARVVLATINGSTSALVFWLIGMPSWLALGVWTGLVAQFVPTIGTYISIILPVLVGLLSPNPWIGVAALVWAIIYQQVENLTIEPRISAKAVDVHPAVSFGSVMIGDGALRGRRRPAVDPGRGGDPGAPRHLRPPARVAAGAGGGTGASELGRGRGRRTTGRRLTPSGVAGARLRQRRVNAHPAPGDAAPRSTLAPGETCPLRPARRRSSDALTLRSGCRHHPAAEMLRG